MKKIWLSLLLLTVLLLSACREPVVVPEVPSSGSAGETTESERDPSLLLQCEGTVRWIGASEDTCAVLSTKDEQSFLLTALEISTGKVLGEKNLGPFYPDLYVSGSHVLSMNWETQCLTGYSRSLEQCWTWDSRQCVCGRVMEDGRFYAITESNELVCINEEGIEEERFPLPEEASGLSLIAARNGLCLIQRPDENNNPVTQWLDLSNGQLLPDRKWECEPSDMYTLYQGTSVSYLREADSENLYTLPETDVMYQQSLDGRVLLFDFGGPLRVWDLKSGQIWAKEVGDGIFFAMTDSRVLYTEGDHPEVVRIWNYTQDAVSDLTGSVLDPSQVRTANQAKADSIQQKSGIQVFMEEQGIAYNAYGDSGYRSDAARDPVLISLALDQTEKLIDEYPKGIFEEMLVREGDLFQLYLGGKIYPTDSDCISTAVAFTNYLEPARVVVADITYAVNADYFRSTLAHELTHVMEDRIWKTEEAEEMNYSVFWYSFSPAPDAYFMSYLDPNGVLYDDITYTAGGNDSDEIYFIDGYSRTFPTEDRARIIENLYLGDASTYCEQLKKGKLAEKAQYLCALIRHCFPSCQVEARLPWEKNIKLVPFSQYTEAIKNYEPEAFG